MEDTIKARVQIVVAGDDGAARIDAGVDHAAAAGDGADGAAIDATCVQSRSCGQIYLPQAQMSRRLRDRETARGDIQDSCEGALTANAEDASSALGDGPRTDQGRVDRQADLSRNQGAVRDVKGLAAGDIEEAVHHRNADGVGMRVCSDGAVHLQDTTGRIDGRSGVAVRTAIIVKDQASDRFIEAVHLETGTTIDGHRGRVRDLIGLEGIRDAVKSGRESHRGIADRQGVRGVRSAGDDKRSRHRIPARRAQIHVHAVHIGGAGVGVPAKEADVRVVTRLTDSGEHHVQSSVVVDDVRVHVQRALADGEEELLLSVLRSQAAAGGGHIADTAGVVVQATEDTAALHHQRVIWQGKEQI